MNAFRLHRYTKAMLSAFGVFAVGLMVTCLFVLVQTRDVTRFMEDLYVHPFSVSNAALEAEVVLESIRERVLYTSINQDKDRARDAAGEIALLDRRFMDNLDIVGRFYLGDKREPEEVLELYRKWMPVRDQILETMRAGHFDRAQHMILTQGTPAFETIRARLDGIVGFARNKAAFFIEEAKGKALRAERTVYLIIVFGFLASSASGLYLVRNVQLAISSNEAALSHRASHDPLTGLANRALLLERLGQAFQAAHGHGTSVGLVFIDLDGFKAVNDTLGHDAGDDLLVQTARRLVLALRGDDTVARLGGDEFVVLVPSLRAGGGAAEQVARKAELALGQPYTIKGRLLNMTASLGVAVSPGDGNDPEGLLASADAAMYRAKSMARYARGGRGADVA